MNRWYPILAFVLLVLVGSCWLMAQDKPEAVGDDGRFGVYHPDRPQPRPDPIDRDTIYATRIVLRGPEVDIVLDAAPNAGNPGITMTDRKTGRAVVLYVEPDGRAVVGVRERGQPNLSAALFGSDGNGFIQLRERGGAHVLRPAEIVNRR